MPIGGFVLQLSLYPVNNPILDPFEDLALQIVEVNIQLTALHHLHNDVTETEVEVGAARRQPRKLLLTHPLGEISKASCFGKNVSLVLVKVAEYLHFGVALDVLTDN